MFLLPQLQVAAHPAVECGVVQAAFLIADELCVLLGTECTVPLHVPAALVAVVELPWVAGVILLDVEDRLVRQAERDFRRDRLAVVVAGADDQRAFGAWLVRISIRLHLDRQEVLRRRDDDLFIVGEQLLIHNHGGGEEYVRHVLVGDRHFDQLRRPGHVYQTIAVDALGLDGEQHIAVVGRDGQHHRRGLAGAEGVLVHDEVHPAGTVAELLRLLRGDADRRLGQDRAVAGIVALPRHPVVPRARRRKDELRVAVGVGLDTLRQNVLALVAAEFQLPRLLVRRGASWESRTSDVNRESHLRGNFINRDLLPVRTDPDFYPVLTRHLDFTNDLLRILIGIERLDIDPHAILRTIDIMLGMQVHVVLLLRHANGRIGDDFAPGGIRHASLDVIFEVLPDVPWGFKLEDDVAGGVGLQRLLLDKLFAVAVRAPIQSLVVVPAELVRRLPMVIKRPLVDQHLHVGVGDRAAEVVVGLDAALDDVADTESLRQTILIGRRIDCYLEFGQLVLFEPQELSRADILALVVFKFDLELAERHLVGQLELAPGAAEGVQLDHFLLYLRAAGVANDVLERLSGGREVLAVLIATGDELPFRGVARAIRRAVGEGVDSPARLSSVVVVALTVAESLTIFVQRGYEHL